MTARTVFSPWRRLVDRIVNSELLLSFCVVSVVIVVGLAFGWENNKLIPVNPAATAHYQAETHDPLSFMANWDGRNYLTISSSGYRGAVQTNFFPLYPLLIRSLTVVVRSPLLAGLLISWASFVGATYFLLRIIKQLYKLKDNLEALRGVLFFTLFPTGVFLFAVYTESLFAFLALAATYAALRKRWLPAALLGALATATHVNGVFLLALVALLLLEQKEKLWKIALGGVIGLGGLLSYMTFLSIKFHDPIAFVHSQKVNGWLNYGQGGLLAELATRKTLFLVLIAVAVVYWWRRRRSFALYAALYVAIVFLGGLGAFGRYALAAFPVPLMFYDVFKDKRVGYPLALAASAIVWTYFLLQFAAGYSGG